MVSVPLDDRGTRAYIPPMAITPNMEGMAMARNSDPVEHLTCALRVYLRGGRLDMGIAGDGDRSREYRVRFVQHLVMGMNARRREAVAA